MTAGPAAEFRTLLYDDFTSLGPISSFTWDYNHFSPVNNPSFYGRTQQRQQLPSASGGLLNLDLDTFNPPPGAPNAFFGSEAISRQSFDHLGAGLAFEVSARLRSATPGIVGGLFLYGTNPLNANLHDELDFELLGNDALAGRNQVQTQIYGNEPLGAGHPEFDPVSGLTSFHTYRIEWYPTIVRWFVDGQLVRESTDHVPQGSLQVHLNIWAPGQEWPDAFSAALQPAALPGANTPYFVDVDYVRVAQLGNLSVFAPGVLALPAFSSNLGGWTGQDQYPRALADLTGDGRADVVGFSSNGVVTAVNLGNGQFAAPQLVLPEFGTIAGGWTSQDQYPRALADLNGDGQADIIGFSGNGVVTSLNQGNGQFAAPQLVLPQFGTVAGGWTSQDQYPRALADVNGDGQADIVGFSSNGVVTSLNQGNGQFAAPQLVLPQFGTVAGGWTSQDQYPRALADVNGDGQADIVGFSSNGVVTWSEPGERAVRGAAARPVRVRHRRRRLDQPGPVSPRAGRREWRRPGRHRWVQQQRSGFILE